MKHESFKKYIEFLDDHIDDLERGQYLDLIEHVLDRVPLKVLGHMTFNNSGESIQLGFKTPDGQCPFCKPKRVG